MQVTGSEGVAEKYTLLLNVNGKERMGVELLGDKVMLQSSHNLLMGSMLRIGKLFTVLDSEQVIEHSLCMNHTGVYERDGC